MIRLFFDIETLPCEDKDKDRFLEILMKKNGNAEKDPEQVFLATNFDGTFGRICCIGYIKEGNGIYEKDVLRGDEVEMLKKFWEISANVHLFVGHNIMEFDLPYIYQRSMIKGVRPTQNLSFAKYRSAPIFDTMKEWIKWGFNANAPKLDTLAKVLDLPTSKDEMDGSMVWPYFKEGKIDEICKYCMKDVVLNRKIYYRMIFEEMPQTEEEEPEDEIKLDETPVIASMKEPSVGPVAAVLADKEPTTEEIPF